MTSRSAEQERRIALLERQRATIAELMERRGALVPSARERESRAAQPPTRSHQAPLVGIRERDVRPDERDAGSARDQPRDRARRGRRRRKSTALTVKLSLERHGSAHPRSSVRRPVALLPADSLGSCVVRPRRRADAVVERPTSGVGAHGQGQRARSVARSTSRAPDSSPRNHCRSSPRPDVVRGLYVNRWAALGDRMWQLIEVAKRTEVNALVIDVKDDRGLPALSLRRSRCARRSARTRIARCRAKRLRADPRHDARARHLPDRAHRRRQGPAARAGAAASGR